MNVIVICFLVENFHVELLRHFDVDLLQSLDDVFRIEYLPAMFHATNIMVSERVDRMASSI